MDKVERPHIIEQMYKDYERKRKHFKSDEETLIEVYKIDAFFEYIRILESAIDSLQQQRCI